MVVGSQAVGRAFRQALRQEYQGKVLCRAIWSSYIAWNVLSAATVSARQAAEDAGRSGIQAAKASNITGMSLSEAKQILNVKDLESMEIIKKVCVIFAGVTFCTSSQRIL